MREELDEEKQTFKKVLEDKLNKQRSKKIDEVISKMADETYNQE